MKTAFQSGRRAALAGALLLPLAVRAGPFTKTGSGRIIQKDIELENFERLSIGGDMAVTLTQSRVSRVSIVADDDAVQAFEAHVSDGLLKLSWRESIRPTKIEIVVSAWVLDGIELSGASALKADPWVSKRLRVQASGASRLTLLNLVTETLNLDMGGACRVKLTGQANDLAASLGGDSQLDAADFEVRRVRATLGGVALARVFASETLAGAVGGASVLRYRGAARVNVGRGGAARLEAQN